MTLSGPVWHAGSFAPGEVAARKAELGVTVSVVVPARDEDGTVAGVVAACRAARGLVDELVVMDGGSTDATAARAAAAGARVVADGSVLAGHGPPLGKGDALWRGLAATTGDLVVYADADVTDPDPRTVPALVGPLLADPGVALVKAFYDRPLQVGGDPTAPGAGLEAAGGGRVTELTARPLLNLFWPGLAGLVQPLSGEYAGRRSLLESIPYFTGYGVELGMLIDTLAAAGPRAIGQVDLERRVHRNQGLDALGRMAYAILQVAARRLADDGRLTGGLPAPPAYVQFTRAADAAGGAMDVAPGGILRRETTVAVVERPPLRTLPGRSSAPQARR